MESNPLEEFLTTVVLRMLYLAPIMHVITLVLSFILHLIGDTMKKSLINKPTIHLITLKKEWESTDFPLPCYFNQAHFEVLLLDTVPLHLHEYPLVGFLSQEYTP